MHNQVNYKNIGSMPVTTVCEASRKQRQESCIGLVLETNIETGLFPIEYPLNTKQQQ